MVTYPTPAGVVEEVGAAVVRNVRPGQFVVGWFFAARTTPARICQGGVTRAVLHCSAEPLWVVAQQRNPAGVPLADRTLAGVCWLRLQPRSDIPSLLAASDVLGTGWSPARTLLGLDRVGRSPPAARRRCRTMRRACGEADGRGAHHCAKPAPLTTEAGSRVRCHRYRCRARRGGRGHGFKELTGGLGLAYSVVESGRSQEAMTQAIGSTPTGWDALLCRRLSMVSSWSGQELFFSRGPPAWRPGAGAPFWPHLIDLIFL